MAEKISLEEQLAKLRQAKNKVLAKERKTLEAIKKKEAQGKIKLGGLVIKSGLKDIDETTLFGVFCFASYYLNASTEKSRADAYFKDLGRVAWDAWGHGKDKEGTAFKDMTSEQVLALLKKIGSEIRPLPFLAAALNPAPVQKPAETPPASTPAPAAQTAKPAPPKARVAVETPAGDPGADIRKALKEMGLDYLDITYRIPPPNTSAKSYQGDVPESKVEAVKQYVESWGGVLIKI